MTDVNTFYRRRIDPENGSAVLWIIVTALLLIMLVSASLYFFSDHPRQASVQVSVAAGLMAR